MFKLTTQSFIALATLFVGLTAASPLPVDKTTQARGIEPTKVFFTNSFGGHTARVNSTLHLTWDSVYPNANYTLIEIQQYPGLIVPHPATILKDASDKCHSWTFDDNYSANSTITFNIMIQDPITGEFVWDTSSPLAIID